MDDFQWVIDHLEQVGNKEIRKGIAWILCGVDETNVYDVHKYLYDIGFTYTTNISNTVEVKDKARVICCIFVEGGIYYTPYLYHDTVGDITDMSKRHSGVSELDVFKWDDGFCLFQETILL
jgi:hypothetical protein